MTMKEAWTLTVDADSIGWLTFDLPGEKVNKLTAAALSELDALLADRLPQEAIAALVVRSGKPGGFIVGADIGELAKITDVEDARAKAEAGKAVFAKLAALPQPTVAVIHGACLGGGLELALACRYRVVTDHPTTSLGVPEVNLGIIPGWGGTVRLPRVVGLAAALRLITAGKPVDGRRAHRMRLADAIAAEPFVEDETRRLIDLARSRRGERQILRRRRRAQPRALRLLAATPPGRGLMLRRAIKEIRRRSGGHYPAPLEAVEVLRRTAAGPLETAKFSVESVTFAHLATTPVSRNLVWLFQAGQRLKKSAPSGPAARTARRAGVLGAGVMGGGIAWALARAGIAVRLKDVSWEALARGTAAAADACRARVKRRRMTAGEMNLLMHRIGPAVCYAGFAGADAVIEAVAEDLELKKRVLAEVEQQVPDDAIICTNTSSLPLEDLASALRNPGRFIGLHFFNPVPRMPLVEVVPARGTERQTIVAAANLVRRMGKTPLVVGGCAGFLVNRILLPYLIESAWMLEEGVDPRRIDRVLERFGMPMGPMALVDEVGIDVGYKVATVLEEAYGRRMHVPKALGAVAGGKCLGRKTGAGIYRYRNGRRRPNRRVLRLAREARKADDVDATALTDEEILDRAVLIMVNEAARCLEEGVVAEPEMLDMAMVMGTGFAPFRGGLLRYADDRGVAGIRKRLDELAGQFGDRFASAPLLERIADDGGAFYQEKRSQQHGTAA